MKRIASQQVLDDIRSMLSERAAGRLSIYDLELCDDQGRPMYFRGAVHGIAVYETADGDPVLCAGVPLGRPESRMVAAGAAAEPAGLGREWQAIARVFPAVAADFRVRCLVTRRAKELCEDYRQRNPIDLEKPGAHVARYPARHGAHRGGWAGALFDGAAVYARTLDIAGLRESWAHARQPVDLKLGDVEPDRFNALPANESHAAAERGEETERAAAAPEAEDESDPVEDRFAEAARRSGRTPAGKAGGNQAGPAARKRAALART